MIASSNTQQNTSGSVLHGDLLVVVSAAIVAGNHPFDDHVIVDGHRLPNGVPGFQTLDGGVGHQARIAQNRWFCDLFFTSKLDRDQRHPDQQKRFGERRKMSRCHMNEFQIRLIGIGRRADGHLFSGVEWAEITGDALGIHWISRCRKTGE